MSHSLILTSECCCVAVICLVFTLDVLTCTVLTRTYPSSEFVVANTLAKWKKLEPNEIDFSQGFSQKVVSRSCSVFNSLPASGNFCHL